MPVDLFRDGLTEALVEFGADLLGSEGLSVNREDVEFNVNLGDVSLLYSGAFRCQAITKLQIPAGGAATYGGAVIFAPPQGLWVRQLSVSGGAIAVWSVITPAAAAVFAAWALNVSWNAWNDDGRGNLTNSTLVGLANGGFLSRPSLYGTADPTVPIQPGAIDAVGMNALPYPIWVPPMQVFYVQNNAANAGMNISLIVQMTSNNPGRFP